MTRKRILILVGALAALAPAATTALEKRPMIVTNLAGSLHVQQSTPSGCSSVNLTTPLAGGTLELTPSEGFDFGAIKYFVLSAGTASFAPFSAHVSCLGGTVSDTRSYSAVGVQLSGAAEFFAYPSAAPGVYDAAIPRQNLLLYAASIVDGEVDAGAKRPKEDVATTIDLEQGTATMQVVLGTNIRFEWPSGCASDVLVPCLLDEEREGTLTATLSGTIVFPDTDGDGVPDRDDNCPYVVNRDQEPVPPIIRPPADLTVASCAEHRFGPGIGIDACRDLPAVVTNDAPGTLRPGANVVNWTAADEQGETSTAPQNVTVADATPPVFTSLPPDVGLANCGPAKLPRPPVADDCGGTPTLTHDAPASFPPGRTDVTWTATDAYRNRATAKQAVTVTDKVAPSVSCVSVGTGLFQVGAADACTSSPVIRLGAYVLANGEIIGITEGRGSGVVLLEDGKIRRFLVGAGEGVITGTDGSGNVGPAACR
jgi:hypothetical protein